ncbi:nucleoside phosphorylase domain-containing protein [Aspergillus bertholletiae]|uniref:Nucleoside phosphorylase domain-containing protein n=1 Tax=Aspergillus bertholletiae TaxID=1226010 RepID=A0A5N7B5V4_9EURO|nr:nucleoside phosphorylase domain-containing protein [Aspergillus bertholletiae]
MCPKSRKNFAVAIICSLSLQADAVEALFDEIYDRLGKYYGKPRGDANVYINGRIGKHDVVLCCMPGIGKGSIASAASSLQVSYTGIKLALIVGICAGAPSPPDYREIFLGDVIISDSVFEYNFGTQYPGGFQRKTTVKHWPGREIRTILSSFRMENARHEFQNRMLQYLHAIQQTGMQWHRPQMNDILFRPSYVHQHSTKASSPNCYCLMTDSSDFICEDNSEVIRCRKPPDAKVSAYFGTLASSDTVVKSGNFRDTIANEEGILGFDIEGVGIWDTIQCIIIKGVCDYANGHKCKAWHKYAAATGASAAKTFLDYWSPDSGRESSHTQRYCPNDFKKSSNDDDFTENGEERWDSILRSRIQNEECFNCGDGGHYESSCHFSCARCKRSSPL